MQIDGYENYEIYETGEILNKKTNKWIKISTRTSKTGYKQLYVCLCKNYKFKSFIVARLLMQYYSPEDDWDSTKEVDHIDGDSTNNKLENLRMVTRSQKCQNTKCSSNTYVIEIIKISNVMNLQNVLMEKHILKNLKR